MNQGFDEVLMGLSNLQESKKKARAAEDNLGHREGRDGTMRILAANITSWRQHAREVMDMPGYILCLSETLIAEEDKPYILEPFRPRTGLRSLEQLVLGQESEG